MRILSAFVSVPNLTLLSAAPRGLFTHAPFRGLRASRLPPAGFLRPSGHARQAKCKICHRSIVIRPLFGQQREFCSRWLLSQIPNCFLCRPFSSDSGAVDDQIWRHSQFLSRNSIFGQVHVGAGFSPPTRIRSQSDRLQKNTSWYFT